MTLVRVVPVPLKVTYRLGPVPNPVAKPPLTESMRTKISPGGSASTTAEANSKEAPLAGGMFPANVPLAGSTAGYWAEGSSRVPSAPYTPCTNAVAVVLEPAARGVTLLVTRGDSIDDGPDRNEFTSKAVTA